MIPRKLTKLSFVIINKNICILAKIENNNNKKNRNFIFYFFAPVNYYT